MLRALGRYDALGLAARLAQCRNEKLVAILLGHCLHQLRERRHAQRSVAQRLDHLREASDSTRATEAVMDHRVGLFVHTPEVIPGAREPELDERLTPVDLGDEKDRFDRVCAFAGETSGEFLIEFEGGFRAHAFCVPRVFRLSWDAAGGGRRRDFDDAVGDTLPMPALITASQALRENGFSWAYPSRNRVWAKNLSSEK